MDVGSDEGFGVVLVFGGLLIVTLYGVLRRVGRSWWLWATAWSWRSTSSARHRAGVHRAAVQHLHAGDEPVIRDPILSMARANGIAADKVYVVDQSRQTTRISANVSGFLGTERISLNDNLLKRGRSKRSKRCSGTRWATTC